MQGMACSTARLGKLQRPGDRQAGQIDSRLAAFLRMLGLDAGAGQAAALAVSP